MSHVGEEKEGISVTVASLDQLIFMVHSHGQRCPLTLCLQSELHNQEVKNSTLEEDPETSMRSAEAEMSLMYVCEGGHAFTWHTLHTGRGEDGDKSQHRSAAPTGLRKSREGRRKGVKLEEACRVRNRRKARRKPVSEGNMAGLRQSGETERVAPAVSGENEEAGNLRDTYQPFF